MRRRLMMRRYDPKFTIDAILEKEAESLKRPPLWPISAFAEMKLLISEWDFTISV